MKKEIYNSKLKMCILGIIVFAIIFFSVYVYNLNRKDKQLNDSLNKLTSVFEKNEVQFVNLKIINDKISLDYQLQKYDNTNNYSIVNSKVEDTEFHFESFCDESVEYVKSSYTAGFERIDVGDCSDISNSANVTGITGSNFSGFDLSVLKLVDYEFTTKNNQDVIEFDVSEVSNDFFAGEFLNKYNTDILELSIVEETKSIILKTRIKHSDYGEMKIEFLVENDKVINKPEIKKTR
ncbi:MAG: hypothetical protein ACK5NF_01775 [Bacilli bacterium]